MTVEPSDLQTFLDDAHAFPTDSTELTGELGDVVLLSPGTDESVTIAEVLTDIDETTYDSPRAAADAITGLLPEGFVGRKYYDDRGEETAESRDPRADDEQESL